VDFDELMRRNTVYRKQELAESDHVCRLGLEVKNNG